MSFVAVYYTRNKGRHLSQKEPPYYLYAKKIEVNCLNEIQIFDDIKTREQKEIINTLNMLPPPPPCSGVFPVKVWGLARADNIDCANAWHQIETSEYTSALEYDLNVSIIKDIIETQYKNHESLVHLINRNSLLNIDSTSKMGETTLTLTFNDVEISLPEEIVNSFLIRRKQVIPNLLNPDFIPLSATTEFMRRIRGGSYSSGWFYSKVKGYYIPT